VGLVVHEGDQGRDDERRGVMTCGSAGERGELVAEALTGASGHDEKDVATGGSSLADLALVGAEIAVAEDAVEEFGKSFGA
jgi:hypothetical protein